MTYVFFPAVTVLSASFTVKKLYSTTYLDDLIGGHQVVLRTELNPLLGHAVLTPELDKLFLQLLYFLILGPCGFKPMPVSGVAKHLIS